MNANVSNRKPHAANAGYVCERKARLGGHVVVYDRRAGFECDADTRWIVQHEPSGGHVAVKTESQARELMKGLAEAPTLEEAQRYADGVLPAGELETEDQAPATQTKGSRPAARQIAAEDQRAALVRFMADPENEPTDAGVGALHFAFGGAQTAGALRRELAYIEEALARPAEDGAAWDERRARLEAREAQIRSALR